MGVTKQGDKWVARISWKGEQLYLKRWDSKEKAWQVCNDELLLLESGKKKPKRGRYKNTRGVSSDGDLWVVSFSRKGKKYYLGRFEDRSEAIGIRDVALEKLRRGEIVKSTTREPSSKYPGVTWCVRTKKWKAYFTRENGKHVHLGYWDDEEMARDARSEWIEKRKENGDI